jgi:murein DD-endopeptidase MepM/ murein hydrolase activator NlpD
VKRGNKVNAPKRGVFFGFIGMVLASSLFVLGCASKKVVCYTNPPEGPEWTHPLPGSKVTSRFGASRDPITKKRVHHNGVDWAATAGTVILAPWSGVVTTATDLFDGKKAYGKTVVIKHENNRETRYHHLKSYRVQEGEQVASGEVIAEVGSTGRSTGPHLHFEVRESGKAIDPASVLK